MFQLEVWLSNVENKVVQPPQPQLLHQQLQLLLSTAHLKAVKLRAGLFVELVQQELDVVVKMLLPALLVVVSELEQPPLLPDLLLALAAKCLAEEKLSAFVVSIQLHMTVVSAMCCNV